MTAVVEGIGERAPARVSVLVLCAEPDLSVRIAHWLGQASFKPLRASDGYDASQVLKREPVVAIVTDRLLPPWPGLFAFPLLRASRPDLAIIYVGNGDDDRGGLARAAGATHVLPRPLRRQSMLDALPRGAETA